MADFKDVIIRLQENKNDNREVIQEQTTVLSNAFKETIKSQNRSFGQSLSRQQQKSSDALSGIASMLGQQTQITKDVTKDDDVVEKQSVGGLEAIAIILTDILGVLNTSLAINQQMADEQERLKLLNQGKAPGVAGGGGGGDDGEETGKKGKGLSMLDKSVRNQMGFMYGGGMPMPSKKPRMSNTDYRKASKGMLIISIDMKKKKKGKGKKA